MHSLRDRIREAEDEATEKENFANRSDVTISSLKKEIQTQQDRLQQVESSLKHHIAAEEEASGRAAKWESKVCAEAVHPAVHDQWANRNLLESTSPGVQKGTSPINCSEKLRRQNMLGKWGILLMRQVVKLFVYCHRQHDLLTNQNSGILIHHGLFPVIKVHY